MKGERSIRGIPFRYAGIMHDYEKTSEEWAEYMPKHMSKCYICGGKMRNCYSPQGTLLKKTYPYIATFRITKGKNKGMNKFRVMCRACAYNLGKGVTEMDGYTYTEPNEFNESRYKEALKRGICANCKHLKKHNGELAEWVCDVKGAVVNDTRIRECDDMWERKDEPQTDGIIFKGNLKEGDYKLIKTTDGWVLEGENIVYCGWERSSE